MTKRIGFWIDMENPYITYDKNYIESLWWIIKQAHIKIFYIKDIKSFQIVQDVGLHFLLTRLLKVIKI